MPRASETHNYALEAGIVTMTLTCACVLKAGTVATAKAQVSSRGNSQCSLHTVHASTADKLTFDTDTSFCLASTNTEDEACVDPWPPTAGGASCASCAYDKGGTCANDVCTCSAGWLCPTCAIKKSDMLSSRGMEGGTMCSQAKLLFPLTMHVQQVCRARQQLAA